MFYPSNIPYLKVLGLSRSQIRTVLHCIVVLQSIFALVLVPSSQLYMIGRH